MKSTLLIIFTIGFVLCFPDSSRSSSQEVTNGLSAYSRDEYSTAFDLFTKSAEVNDPEGLYYLGRLHIRGEGTKKNDYKAYKLIKKSAELHFVDAEYLLGIMYLTGTGIGTDRKTALHWFERAGEQGHTKAQYRAAEISISKWPPDKSLNLYEKAARSGHVEAQFKLGGNLLLLAKNQDDRIKTYYWLKIAANNGHKKAASLLKTSVTYLSAEELIEAEKLVKNWEDAQ
ncbi:tetratricopeptide repeat protein [Kiloniella antarctica]|uniref:Tetratricopeptide repeat protein n=1 Tax=Kiloniella antarctica TaxID=1550907 RepID=A0ABW5BI83_9PROT